MKKQEAIDHGTLDQSIDEKHLSQLMLKSLEGDGQSYRQLLEKVSELMEPFIARSLTKFGLSSSGGHEDVLQEILLAIHQKRASFDPSQYFLPWVYAIARYKTIDYLRRNKVSFHTDSIGELNFEFENVNNENLGNGLDIQTLCEKLPHKQRKLLLLVKVEGLSINETALKTGFSPSDVKVTIHRALKGLKKIVEDENHEKR
jgi:RNA polymerase sigma-70 factor (ECF subfamily)